MFATNSADIIIPIRYIVRIIVASVAVPSIIVSRRVSASSIVAPDDTVVGVCVSASCGGVCSGVVCGCCTVFVLVLFFLFVVLFGLRTLSAVYCFCFLFFLLLLVFFFVVVVRLYDPGKKKKVKMVAKNRNKTFIFK